MGLLKKLGGLAKKAAPFMKYMPGPVGTALSVVDAGSKGGNTFKNLGGDFLNRAKVAGPLLLGGAGAGALGGGAMGAGGQAAAASGGGGGWMGALGGGLKKLGGENALDLALGAGSLYQGIQADRNASKANKRATQLQDRAMAMAEQQYNERAPMRKLGMDMALNQQPEDVSGLYQSSNPFARRPRVL